MRNARISWIVLVFVVTWRASAVRAGPVEQLRQLMFQPGNTERAILRYDNGGDGLFYSDDGGKTFGLVCTSAIDPSLARGGPIAITADGKTLLGVFNGMYQDDGSGCAWSRIDKLAGRWIGDFALHPTDPSITYTVSANGSPAMNGIFVRDKNGDWTDVGTREDIIIGALHVIDMGGGKLRFYESASRGTKMDDAGLPIPNYVIRVSNDEGKTWDEHVFADAGNNTLRLVAVDPMNPDRLVVTVNRAPDDDSVYISEDQGVTFTEWLKVTEIGGVAIAPDGRVWIGDSGDTFDPTRAKGLWSAASLSDQAPKKIGDYVVQCVTYEPKGETLYVCQHWWLGTADPATGTFTSFFKLQEAKGFLDCPGKNMPDACKMQLCGAYCGPGHFAQAPLCEAYTDPLCGPAIAPKVDGGGGGSSGGTGGATVIGTGGVAAAGSGGTGGSGTGGGTIDAGTQNKPKSSSGCSCALVGSDAGSHAGLWLGVIGFALTVALRRRRRA